MGREARGGGVVGGRARGSMGVEIERQVVGLVGAMVEEVEEVAVAVAVLWREREIGVAAPRTTRRSRRRPSRRVCSPWRAGRRAASTA